MHGIARCNHHDARGDGNRREQIEEERRDHNCPFPRRRSSAVGRVKRDVTRDLALPAVTIGEKLFLVV